MKKIMTAILNLVQSVFGWGSSANGFRPRTTSNGYKIYYDKTSGEAVGIVYKKLVFLKAFSERKMNWYEAVEYCKTIVINGIVAELCPVMKNWETEFRDIYCDLKQALKEIGAEKSDYCTWCSEKDDLNAWCQYFIRGNVYPSYKGYDSSYVRPVLVLKR